MKVRLLNKLRDFYRQLNRLPKGLLKSEKKVNLSIEEYNAILFDVIENSKPFLISRFGSAELNWYLNYKILNKNIFNRLYSYITLEIDTINVEEKIINDLTFVPRNLDTTAYFIEEMDNAIPKIDILGSWLRQEQSSQLKLRKNSGNIQLGFLEPYYSNNPWTAALKGKKVLVIHPMKNSILSQYQKREFIFINKNILPKFDLEVLEAPYFDNPEFEGWKSIMDYYIKEIKKYDFDVAILGCGSWGMPLAARIKDMGKVAIHLGGATQLLFGIIGSRWETLWPQFRELDLINDNWVRPLLTETPIWATNYDKKSYW